MKKPVALITGVNGQDGSYLSEYLLSLGYEVHGMIRRASTFNRSRIDHLRPSGSGEGSGLHLHYGDVTDSSSIRRILRDVSPDEVYHLAAQSHVGVSFEVPEYTADSVAVGTLRLLDAIRAVSMTSRVRVYNAVTSELYGGQGRQTFSEESAFYPRSPYGVAKLYSYWIAKNYREAFGMRISNGILFNHESPRRGENFVTRKVSQSLAHISTGSRRRLVLGNLDAARDWGYAPDYVKAMHAMLQGANGEDYVVATGKVHTVRQFVEAACDVLGITLEWRGSGIEELGVDVGSGEVVVEVSPMYFRPTEVDWLCGDSSRIKRDLGWESTVDFHALVEIMVRSDLEGREVWPDELR